MPKLIMMRGLPASGKSTKAQILLKESGNSVRVNKDLIRKMLHFDKWTPNNERHTKAAEVNIAREFLHSGINVIVDDTNLGQSHLDTWKNVAKEEGATFQMVELPTKWQVCVERDKERTDSVGEHVIKSMALQYGLTSHKSYVICDIDGTIADITHRLAFVKKEEKDWEGFFSKMEHDSVRNDVKKIVFDLIKDGKTLVYVSARPDKYREVTQKWLKDNFLDLHFTLLMRKSGDKRPDNDVKQQILNTYFPEKGKIACVVDDRPRVIKMWRENGLEVIDVGNGEDF